MGNAAKVLIAEQDQSVIRLLKTVLTNAGHRVVLAKDGEKALQSVSEYDIDLALIDLDLKGTRAIDLARKIKKDHPDIDVAFLCYFGTARSAIAAADSGVDRFILKPFDDLASVSRTIKEILAKRGERLRRSAAADDGEAEAGADASGDDAEAKVRVVVADSDKDDRDLIGKALEKLGCEVTYATCAQEALLHLSNDEHDVLVVAYDMGDMTADDVLLRARRFDDLVSVVVTSPSPTLAQTTSLIKKGASGFVEKPLQDPARTAESIFRRGQAVLLLRDERAQEQAAEAEEAQEAEEAAQVVAAKETEEPDGDQPDDEQADDDEGAPAEGPRDGFHMNDDEEPADEGDDADDTAAEPVDEPPDDEDEPPPDDEDDEGEPPEEDEEERDGDEDEDADREEDDGDDADDEGEGEGDDEEEEEEEEERG